MTSYPTPGIAPWDVALQAKIDADLQAIRDLIAGLAGFGGDMLRANNLSDVDSVPQSRANLGLGTASTADVGTDAGTVAAGDDLRIANALQANLNLLDILLPSVARANLDVYSTGQVDALTGSISVVTSVDGQIGDVDLSTSYDVLGAASTAQAAAIAASQPVDSDLTAIAALTTTSYGRGLLELADGAALIIALGLGTASTHAATDFDAAGAASAAQAAAIAASQPVDADLTAIAALTTTSYGRAFLALADAAAARTALGLGTAATSASTAFDAAGAAAAAQAASQPVDSDLTAIAALTTTSYGRAFLALADAAAARTAIGAVIGTNVEAWSARLDTLASTTDTGSGAIVRSSSPAITTPTGIVKGDVGLGNVDNTSDVNKPVSTAQAAADTALRNNATGVLINSRKTWIAAQNFYQLRHFLGLLPQAASTPIKLFFDGDSIAEGTNTTSIHERWVNQLKDQISAAVGADATSFGYIPALYSGVVGNPAWQTTLVSGDAGALNANGIGRRSWLSASGATNQRTWTSVPCDRLAVLYNKGSNRGKIEVRIDNVLVASFDTWQAGAGPTAAKWDSVTDGAITITPGVHTIKLTTINTGTGATYACDIAGIFPYWQNHDAGVQLWEGAHSALPSLQFSAIELAHITLIDPDLVLHCKGVNDSTWSLTSSDTAATLAFNVAAVNALGIGDVSHAFFAAWGNAGAQTPSQWLPYHDAIFNAAIGVAAFADQGESLGWPATDATAISDSIAHPNAQGSEITASIVADALHVPPVGRNRTGWRLRLPGRGFFDFYEVGGFAVAGLGIQGDVQERVYLSGLGGVGWSDGTATAGPLMLYSAAAGAINIKAGAVYTPLQTTVRQPVPTVHTTSFTTALADEGVPILIGSVSATAVTIPPNASVAYGVGATLDITSTNSGVVTITAGAGVTITNQTSYGLGLNLSGSRMVLRQDAIDSWTVIYANDLVAYTLSERATAATLANKTLTSPVLTTPTLGVASGTSLALSSFVNEAKGADIASATTTDIGAATGNYIQVTGTTTITGLGTVQAGTRRIVKFTGALILTHNATSLILPGSANITTVAGDTAMFVSLGSGNWICVAYQPVTVTGTGSTVLAASPTFTGTVNTAAVTMSGTLTLFDGGTVGTGGTTGTIFGGTFEKLSFFGKTPPITVPAAATDLGTVLSNLGLRTAGTAYPITTSAAVTMSGTVATGALTTTGAHTATGAITSSSATGGVGYATGAGGAVTQLTSKTTAFPTISKTCGTLTWNNAALASDTTATSASSTNTAIAATDAVVFTHISGGTLGAYNMTCTPGSGTWTLTLRNLHSGSLSEAPVFAYAIVKAVTS